jgi:hypothetical protein
MVMEKSYAKALLVTTVTEPTVLDAEVEATLDLPESKPLPGLTISPSRR